MVRSILQPRDGIMFANIDASVEQRSTDAGNFGEPLEFSSYSCIAFQVWWAGINGPGIFQLQTSLKSAPVESDWVSKIGASIAVTAGTGTDIKVVTNIGEKSVRMIWMPTDVTTGVVSSELMAKDAAGPGSFTKDDPLQVTSSFTGLRVGGLITEVPLNITTWTPLPASALPNRNAMSIQNFSGIEIKINYTNSAGVAYVGMIIADKNERFYDVSDQIIIYGKSLSGTPTVTVEEIA